jgi:hypothetical protein
MTVVTKSYDQPLVLNRGRTYHERVKYVVGSECQQILIAPVRHGADDGLRAPDGTRHAVDRMTNRASCGVTTNSLFVFRDLDWTTMLSNEMCPRCKRTAF